jgi:hypothetical protein
MVVFSGYAPVSSTSKTDHHIIAEILLKVVLNTTTLCNVQKCKTLANFTKKEYKPVSL